MSLISVNIRTSFVSEVYYQIARIGIIGNQTAFDVHGAHVLHRVIAKGIIVLTLNRSAQNRADSSLAVDKSDTVSCIFASGHRTFAGRILNSERAMVGDDVAHLAGLLIDGSG